MTGIPDIRLTPIGYVHSSRRDLEAREAVRQPQWSTELMRQYWRAHD
jgi:hypothetical protein